VANPVSEKGSGSGPSPRGAMTPSSRSEGGQGRRLRDHRRDAASAAARDGVCGCALAALERRNIAEGPLLHRAGLPEFELDNSRRRVTAAAQGEFLEYAAQALNDTAFGLYLAEQANPLGRPAVLRRVRRGKFGRGASRAIVASSTRACV
jgi:hypothetical protein